jgi:hypothetical protein
MQLWLGLLGLACSLRACGCVLVQGLSLAGPCRVPNSGKTTHRQLVTTLAGVASQSSIVSAAGTLSEDRPRSRAAHAASE